MAAKTWDTDFRKDAIEASIRAVGTDDREDPFPYPGSFCLPIGERPIVGWTPESVALCGVASSVVLLLAAASIHGFTPPSTMRRTAAIGCVAIGIVMFVGFLTMDRTIMWFLIRERAARLRSRVPRGKTATALVSHANKDRLMVTGESDYVLILFDQPGRRILMEGIGARYRIRAQDILSISRFEFKTQIGAEIAVRIAKGPTLRIVLANASFWLGLTHVAPGWVAARPLVPNRLYRLCGKTLELNGQ